MATTSDNADVVIEEIDAGRLQPMMLAVVRNLHRHMLLSDPLQIDALAAFDRGDQPGEMTALQSLIWAKITSLGVGEESGLRLSNCLTRPDEAVDWVLGEYLIHWARQQGLTEHQIIMAFRAKEACANER